MGLGDLFKRGNLLPKREQAGGEDPRNEGQGAQDDSVFDRTTVIPEPPQAEENVTVEDVLDSASSGSVEVPSASSSKRSDERVGTGTKPSPGMGDEEETVVNRNLFDLITLQPAPLDAEALEFETHAWPGETEAEPLLESGHPLSSSATLDLSPHAISQLAGGDELEAESIELAANSALAFVDETDAMSEPRWEGDESCESERETPVPRVSSSPLSDLYAVGDFTGALRSAEARLAADPDDAEASRYAARCRDVLTQMYLSRLGDLRRPVRLLVPPSKLKWLSIDHKAGFVISLIDGTSSVEDVLDLCAMPNVEAMRIMVELLEKEVVAFG